MEPLFRWQVGEMGFDSVCTIVVFGHFPLGILVYQ